GVHRPRGGGVARVPPALARADGPGPAGRSEVMTDTNAVLGYATPLVVAPGEEIRFHLSSAVLSRAQARVVRVRCADPDPAGPGILVSAPGSAIDGPVTLRHQPIHPGSFGIVAEPQGLDGLVSLSIGAYLWPTTPGTGEQTILSRWSERAGWR